MINLTNRDMQEIEFRQYREGYDEGVRTAQAELAALQKRVAELDKAFGDALKDLSHYAPQPSHKGSCGPWAPCDRYCADAATFNQQYWEYRKVLENKTALSGAKT